MTTIKRILTVTALSVFLVFVVQSMPQMAQEREGDGKEFVVLTVNLDGRDTVGTVSLANMEGQDGQCAAVVNPPNKDHATKISDAQLRGNALAFKGSQYTAFEMTVVGNTAARLKFMDTPVEGNPWQLTKTE